jgi:hypothetical protein
MSDFGNWSDGSNGSSNGVVVTEGFGEPPAWLSSFPFDRCIRAPGRVLLPLGEQLLPALQLASYGAGRIQELTNNKRGQPRPSWENLIVILSVRVWHLHGAALRLVRSGYVAAALAPARALFELMLNIYWLYEHRHTPELIARHLLEHETYHQRDQHGKLLKVPGYEGHLPSAPPFTSASEAKKERFRYGGSYTAESINKRIERWTYPNVEGLADNASPDDAPFFPEEGVGSLALVYTKLIHASNLSLHSAALDYHDTTSRVKHSLLPTGQATYTAMNPSLRLLQDALMTAHWSYDRVVRLVLRHNGVELDELNSVLSRFGAGQAAVSDDNAARASRNDPCPCGATNGQGRSVKHKSCHGRASMPIDEVEAALFRAEVADYPSWA